MVSACTAPAPDTRYDGARLLAARAAKDEQFRTASDSPVPVERRTQLLPLAYFPPDPDYDVPAVLEPPPAGQPAVQMPTSTGDVRSMRQAGLLKFTLKGHPLVLAAFTESDSPDPNRLFVPFTDLTSGLETYKGGRYLDLERTPTGVYNVDFNRAYQPYCYYNPTYDCPVPPAQNRLQVPIRAGERMRTSVVISSQ